MKQDLIELLIDIFKSAGYNFIKSDIHDIVVERNGHKTFVKCTLQPEYKEIKKFSEQIKGGTGIYVMTQKTNKDLFEYAAKHGIYVWDQDGLALQIGRAVLTNLKKKANQLKQPETARKNDPVSERLPQEGSARNMGCEVTCMESCLYSQTESEPGEKPSHLEDRPKPFVEGSERDKKEAECFETPGSSFERLNIKSIEPKVSKEQAMAMAKPYLNGINDAVLKFVPLWRYAYTIDLERKVRTKLVNIMNDGKGYLNALNKNIEETELEGVEASIPVPTCMYEIKKPVLDRKQAEDLLMDMIIEENTKHVRFNDTNGQVIIYENKSVRPRQQEIEMELELVYVPVWEVKGRRNSLEINAYNAQVLEEPMDNDAEFV